MLSKPISRRAKSTGDKRDGGNAATLAYVAPFVIFVAMVAVRRWLPLAPEWFASLRFALVAAALLIFSRQVIPWRLSFAIGSVLLGVAVFVIWVCPDTLWP